MRILPLLLALLVSACGGGGSSSTPLPTPPPGAGADPFGIDQRITLSPPDLPTGSNQPGAISLVEAFPNLAFSSPLYLAAVPGEDRLAVVEQGGRILVFDRVSTTSNSRVVFDLSARVLFSGEQGLLGLAFDPGFNQNRFLYVHYSMDSPRRSVIARFTWDAVSDLVDLTSEKTVLEINQPFSNHNGGMLAFGPEGFLYIAMGDGGSGGDPQNNAQNMNTFLGKMLRIDVTPQNPMDAYDIPADNPFVNQSGVLPEIWASGLRNPFRFSFDRQTGELWLGDVGQGNLEEIDLISKAGNYGWRVFEGTQPFDGSANSLPDSAFTPPIVEYDHSEGVAVIGGYVYRGSQIPSLLGVYLYSDFGSGTVWALNFDGSSPVSNTIIATASAPTSFGEDNDGEMYLVSRGGSIFNFEETTQGGGGTIPVNLSDTGLFSDLTRLTSVPGLIEYDINLPFWSDGTQKRRWVGIPGPEQIIFSSTGNWELPLGSVVVKHFEIETVEGDPSSVKRLETRVLVKRASGWEGYTWRWNAEGTEALLLAGRETESIDITTASGASRLQQYDYPSRTDCLQCHAATEGFILGLRTRQMNRNFDYSGVTDNQLRSFNHIGLFNRDIGDDSQYEAYSKQDDSSASLASRARTYLAVNCSPCHQAGGSAPVNLDLGFDTALADTNALDAQPQTGSLGIVNARLIAPGAKERSILWVRMGLLDGNRMPPLSSHLVDQPGLLLVGEWIDSL